MICCVADGAVAQVVVPFGLAKSGLLSGCPVALGIIAVSEQGGEDGPQCYTCGPATLTPPPYTKVYPLPKRNNPKSNQEKEASHPRVGYPGTRGK